MTLIDDKYRRLVSWGVEFDKEMLERYLFKIVEKYREKYISAKSKSYEELTRASLDGLALVISKSDLNRLRAKIKISKDYEDLQIHFTPKEN
jgi:hypothetical protein